MDKEKSYLPQEWLVLLRQRSGWTQGELASQVGLRGPRMVQNWEGGYGLPKPDRLKKLIELYLVNSVFTRSQEKQEARQVWAAVKNMFETNSSNYELYPVFDENWFATLQHANGTTAQPSVSKPAILTTAPQPPTNLPVTFGSFIGRKHELELLPDLLRREHLRLVTLVGPGGIGKTRLALEVANRLRSDFQHGSWLVELAPLSDADLLGRAIADVLGIAEESNSPVDTLLISFLKERHLLLVLDNIEHLLAACATLVLNLLKNCPGLKVLMTSRQSLGVGGEIPFTLASLRLPPVKLVEANPYAQGNLEALAEYDAVKFFLERAALADSAFKLTADTAPYVIKVCQYLDGIPLALELAAARLKILSIAEIARRLNNAFPVLTGNRISPIHRQQTMRASLDWSYELLTSTEQTLLGRLAVFNGGWTLEAVEEICAEPGVAKEVILELLANLADKSLIVSDETDPESAGSPSIKKLRLLEIIRQYALEKLILSGEEARIRGQHLAYFVKLTRRAEPKIRGIEQLDWFKRLEAEYDNFGSALEYVLQAEPTASASVKLLALELVMNMYWFWYIRGRITEGRNWLERILSYTKETQTHYLPREALFRVKALTGLVIFCWSQHDYDQGLVYVQEALELANQVAELQSSGLAKVCMGMVLFSQGKIELVAEWFEQGLSDLNQAPDKWYLGQGLYLKGITLLRQASYKAAAEYFEESLKIFKAIGDRRFQAWVFYYLSQVQFFQQNYSLAGNFARQSFEMCQQTGDKRGMAWALQCQAVISLRSDAFQEAKNLLEESLKLHRQLGAGGGILTCLEWLSWISFVSGEVETAKNLTATIQQMRENLDVNIIQAIRPDLSEWLFN